MFRLGLTGSIGTGKSTTAQIFRDLGVPVHDADAAVHALYRGAAVPLIEAEFPGVTANGTVNRKALGALVIGKPDRFAALERIVHPLVRKAEEEAEARARAAGHRLLVLDIPLLFETKAQGRCNAILVTSVNAEEQKRRVLARPGINEALFHDILRRQMPDHEKRRHAHAILDTGLGLAHAQREILALLRALRSCL